jgi:hypothetical protein
MFVRWFLPRRLPVYSFWLGSLVTPDVVLAQQEPERAPAAVIVPPKLLSDASIPYPEGGRDEVVVVLTLVVAPDGSVRSAVANEPNLPFSEIAERAALTWTFEPATRDGKAVAAKLRFEVTFRPPSEEAPQTPAADANTAPPNTSKTPSSTAALPAGVKEPGVAPAEKPVEFVVQGVQAEPSRTASLSRAEVRQIPGTFGDPFRAVETLPGVTPIVSGLPFFFIRGAPPGNAGYFLDGIRVPLLFHVGVGPSVVHPALIERVDLYPGGYPARFGRFSGGIVSGETVAPTQEFHGEYNVRLFDAGALAEAPFAGGRGSVLLGGRYSYTAALLSQLSPETTLDYWDYQARASYAVDKLNTIGVFAFGSYDFLGEKTPTETLTLFGTEFHRVDFRYDRVIVGHGALRTAFTLGYDRSRLQEDRFTRDRLLGTRTELNYRLSSSALLRAGTDMQVDTYDVQIGSNDLSPATARVSELFPTRTDIALGARADVVLTVQPGFEVTPGVRVDAFGSQGAGALAVDPRLALRVRVIDDIHFLSALGIAHQAPSFVVPVPGFQPGGLRGGLQRSLQESMGLEFDLGDATTATVTVFQNAFFDMSDPLGSTEPQVNGCPPGTFPSDSLAGDRAEQPTGNPYCGPRFIPGTLGPDRSGGGGQAADSRGGRRAAAAFEVRSMGSARGLELYLKRRLTSKLGGFISYTLSRSTRSYGRRNYTASFDRTHVLNAALAYNLGRNWRAGTRGMFYTGLPQAAQPGVSESSRLPAFFRLDLRVEKRFQFTESTWLSFVAEWMNATLSKEAVSTSCTLSGCEARTIGPITIPSIGVEGGF